MITAEEILDALLTHTNVLLYGPPGTGKSYLMRRVQRLFEMRYDAGAGSSLIIDTEAERNAIAEHETGGAYSRWVTFHQGYSYEDFVIGLRPKTSSSGEGSLSLEARAGALLELAALSRNGHGLMLIDEINRGNTSRIFGEFITLMEADKRLSQDGTPSTTTVTVTLPYIAAGELVEVAQDVVIDRQFAMPQNVYTLASMNSVDKSVAPIDAAVRRRFYVLNLRPDKADLEKAAGFSTSAPHSVARLAARVIEKVNRGIGIYLGPEYMLGQYYLPAEQKLGEMTEDRAMKIFIELWRSKILPQVLELFQARPAVCIALLSLNEIPNSGLKVIQPTDSEADEGAATFILNVAATTTDDDIFSYLERYVADNDGSDSISGHDHT